MNHKANSPEELMKWIAAGAKPKGEPPLAPAHGSTARFKITGRFIGGCAWESRQTFDTREQAEMTMAQWKKEEVCKSTNYQIEQVP